MSSSYEIDLLSRLVAINSDSVTKNDYEKCAQLVEQEARKLGLRTTTYDAVNLASDGKPRPNVVIDFDVGAKQKLLLVTHYDIVPPGEGWKHDPFKLTLEGEKAYGRGASDDKSGIVTCLGALRELSENGSKVNVSLLVCGDEEVGGLCGIGYLTKEIGIRGDAGLIVDAGPEIVSTGSSGPLWGKITIEGKQGHGGYPHHADNPIQKALPFLMELSEYSKVRERVRSRVPAPPGSPFPSIWGRFTITMVNSGYKENIIPATLEARFDLRVCPDEDYKVVQRQLTEHIHKLAEKHRAKIKLEYTYDTISNYFLRPDHPLVRYLSEAVEATYDEKVPVAGELGGNDGHFLAEVGIPTISFGPLREDTNFHGPEEFVYIKDIEMAKKTFVHLCRNWKPVSPD